MTPGPPVSPSGWALLRNAQAPLTRHWETWGTNGIPLVGKSSPPTTLGCRRSRRKFMHPCSEVLHSEPPALRTQNQQGGKQ